MSPLRKLAAFKKWTILDEIFLFRNSMMPEQQWIEKMENTAKRYILGVREFS